MITIKINFFQNVLNINQLYNFLLCYLHGNKLNHTLTQHMPDTRS